MRNSIVNPIFFDDEESMHRWLEIQKSEVLKICKEYNVTDINSNPFEVDKVALSVGLKSLGTYLQGSNRELAIKEIIMLFN